MFVTFKKICHSLSDIFLSSKVFSTIMLYKTLSKNLGIFLIGFSFFLVSSGQTKGGGVTVYGHTPMYGSGQTPMYGNQTPMHGSRTPMYGNQTPMHDGKCFLNITIIVPVSYTHLTLPTIYSV